MFRTNTINANNDFISSRLEVCGCVFNMSSSVTPFFVSLTSIFQSPSSGKEMLSFDNYLRGGGSEMEKLPFCLSLGSLVYQQIGRSKVAGLKMGTSLEQPRKAPLL